MDEMICPNCGTPNRKEARFCAKCGMTLAEGAQPFEGGEVFANEGRIPLQTMFDQIASLGKGFFKKIGAGLGSLVEREESASGVQERGQPAPSAAAPTTRLSAAVLPKQPGEQIQGYTIFNVRALLRSNYYDVRSWRCPQGHINQGTTKDRCDTCQAELPVYLMHETAPDRGMLSETHLRTLVELSYKIPAGLLKHHHLFEQGGRHYAVTEFPTSQWYTLAQLPIPFADTKLIVAWCQVLGKALGRLSQQNYLLPEAISTMELFEAILLASNGSVALSDLTYFVHVPRPAEQNTGASPAEGDQRRTIAILGQMLYTLASGNNQKLYRASGDLPEVPAQLRRVIQRVRGDQYENLAVFLDDLQQALVVPELTRSLRQNAGYSTDVGRERDHNEDFVGFYSLGLQQTPEDPQVGLCLVADGMGGHQAGELASKEVVRTIVEQITEKAQELEAAPKLKRATVKLDEVVTLGEVLKQAILRGNEILLTARRARASDRGTTITAALIMGERAAIANVGDSRTYLMRAGKLEQITHDHSLVYNMVSANMLKPEEVRTHPQRNQIFRSLGDKSNLEVDIFERNLQAGDKLLLCSDGLWEMVLDGEIEKILREAASPQSACDRLIEAANLAGGEDNIGVVALWIE